MGAYVLGISVQKENCTASLSARGEKPSGEVWFVWMREKKWLIWNTNITGRSYQVSGRKIEEVRARRKEKNGTKQEEFHELPTGLK
jgi:hypothetical protein